MKILVLASSYPRWESDIAGCFVERWAEQCVAHGARVHVMCWEDDVRRAPMQAHPRLTVEWVPYEKEPHTQRLFYGAGAPEHIDEATSPRARLGVLTQASRAMMAMTWRATQAIQHIKPDLIVGHWLAPAGLLAAALGRAHSIPCGIVTHSGGVHMVHRMNLVGVGLARAIHLGTQGNLTFTQSHLQRLFSKMIGADHVGQVLPMGFDAPTRTSSGEDWLVLGRLVPIKRVDRALHAFATSRACARGRVLHVIGDGPCRPSLEAQAARYVQADIRFYGIKTGAERDDIIGQCNVAMFPSMRLPTGRAEGLPVSFLEVSSAGLLPLVSQQMPVEHLLCDSSVQRLPHDPALWAEHINQSWELSQQDALRQGMSQRVAPYEWSVLGERWWQAVCQWRGDLPG